VIILYLQMIVIFLPTIFLSIYNIEGESY